MTFSTSGEMSHVGSGLIPGSRLQFVGDRGGHRGQLDVRLGRASAGVHPHGSGVRGRGGTLCRRSRGLRLRLSPAVGEVALQVRPAARLVGHVALVAAQVGQGIDPLVPEAVGLGEAVGVVGAEVGVKAEEGAKGCGLVVAEVGAGEVMVEVGGEDLGSAWVPKRARAKQ